MIVMVWSPTRPRDKRDRRRPPALWGVPSHIAHCTMLHMLDTVDKLDTEKVGHYK